MRGLGVTASAQLPSGFTIYNSSLRTRQVGETLSTSITSLRRAAPSSNQDGFLSYRTACSFGGMFE